MTTVKKPLTAETAEKKILWILGELCVLCGKTWHFFTRSKVLRHVCVAGLKSCTLLHSCGSFPIQLRYLYVL